IAGPAIGGFLAVFGRWTVFVATGFELMAAAPVVAWTLKRSAHERIPVASIPLGLLGRSRAGIAVRAVIVLSIGMGLLIGIYDVIWSLYMRTLGASDVVIGL